MKVRAPFRRVAMTAAVVGISLATASAGFVGLSASAAGAAKKKSPVKIGMAIALSGTEATIMEPTAAVAKAWVSWTNANGGIGGHPVRLYVQDTEGTPARFMSVVQSFVNTDHVAAVMTADDVADSAGITFLSSHKIPVIGVMGFDGGWGTKPNYYPVFTQIPSTILGQVASGSATKSKTFGTVVCQEVAACLQVATIFKPAVAAAGMKWAGLVTASASAPNYTSQCLTLIQAGATFISMNIQVSEHKKFVGDCLQQGFKGWFGSDANGFEQSNTGVTGAKIAGNMSNFPYWAKNAPVKKFRSVMAKYQPKATYKNGESTGAWADLQLLKKALGKPSGNVTAAKVTAAYSKIKNQTLTGLLPQPITFTAGKPAPNVHCYWLFKWKAGQKWPTSVRSGKSGNGASGDLASTCSPAPTSSS